MNFLRQSTSVDVGIGPFVDQTDGFTAETALTITQPDVRLKKNGGAWAQKAAAQTLSHEENGWYEVTLDATDTNTVGILIVAIAESGALPVWIEFQVVEEAVYDAFYAAAAPGLVGTAQTGDNFARLGAPAGASVSADIAAIEAQTDDIGAAGAGLTAITALLPAALVSGRIDASVGAMAANVLTATAINADAFTAAKFAADVTTEFQTGLATAAALTVVDDFLDTEIAALTTAVADLPTNAELATALGTADDAVLTAIADLPTNAELATALGTADDATLAAIAALNNLSAAAVNAEVDTAIADAFNFTAGSVDSNITHVIADPVIASSGKTTNWGGTP